MKMQIIIAPSIQGVHATVMISDLSSLRPKKFYFNLSKDLMVIENENLLELYIYLL